MGFVDLQGNARLVFGGVFIDRQVASKPAVERRELRSVFKLKSAQVLRLMLREPSRAWSVAKLAEAASVSLGHVSNVRSCLLDAWCETYVLPAGKRHNFYTTLHGTAFESVVRELGPVPDAGSTALVSFSAGQWLAPYGHTGTQYFYADAAGLDRLRSLLKLCPASKGENVAVTVLEYLGVFRRVMVTRPSTSSSIS